MDFMNFTWLSHLDPIWGIYGVMGLYAAIGLWALQMGPERARAGAADKAKWRDLRWWVLPLIVSNLALYWYFR